MWSAVDGHERHHVASVPRGRAAYKNGRRMLEFARACAHMCNMCVRQAGGAEMEVTERLCGRLCHDTHTHAGTAAVANY